MSFLPDVVQSPHQLVHTHIGAVLVHHPDALHVLVESLHVLGHLLDVDRRIQHLALHVDPVVLHDVEELFAQLPDAFLRPVAVDALQDVAHRIKDVITTVEVLLACECECGVKEETSEVEGLEGTYFR